MVVTGFFALCKPHGKVGTYRSAVEPHLITPIISMLSRVLVLTCQVQNQSFHQVPTSAGIPEATLNDKFA